VRRPPDRGFALLLALAVLLLVAAAVLLAFRTALSGKNALERERRLIELRAASDAVLAETMAALDEDPGFSGVAPRSFGGASIVSRVTRRSDGNLDVAAVARRGAWEMGLSAVVHMDPKEKAHILSWNRSPARLAGRSSVSVLR